MFIADYVMNSGLANSWANGLLTWTLPADFETYNLPVRTFITDDFVQWFPDIVNKYQAGSKIQVKCSDVDVMPTVKSTDTAIEGFEHTSCMMSVMDNASGTYIDIMSFTSDFNWKGKLELENGNMIKLVAHEGTASNVVIVMSTMADVTSEMLTTMLNQWMTTMMPMMSSFRLPIGEFVTLINPVISYHMGYVQLVSNAKFTSMTC